MAETKYSAMESLTEIDLTTYRVSIVRSTTQLCLIPAINTKIVVDETYIRVHILSSFGHACLRAQPLAWPMTVSEAGGWRSFLGQFRN